MVVNKDDSVLLSIIIPVFNRQKTFNRLMAELSHAISHHQLKQQLETQIEVIVIDDASSKPITLPDFPGKIIYKRNKKNSGAPFSRTKGLQLSHGKFVHFHDSDDSISDNWLKELLAELVAKPDIDMLVTGRIDHEQHKKITKYPKFFHKQIKNPKRILARLIYWNHIGPIGGVTFSRKILDTITIKSIASCQDWQMYIDVIKNAHLLSSQPEIQFLFIKTGNDRISHNPRKKILGHLQLAKQTNKDSIFGKKIRLFYLYSCKNHIFNQGGTILKFYKKHQIAIFLTFLVIAAYSFMPRPVK